MLLKIHCFEYCLNYFEIYNYRNIASDHLSVNIVSVTSIEGLLTKQIIFHR